jgi:protein SCO1/2
MNAHSIKLFALVACLVGLIASGCSEPPKFNATDISGVDWGKDFSLTDHTGQTRKLADYRGKAVVLFFGYTQCPDICPTTLATMRDAVGLLGADAARVQVLFVTVDPARDTQQVLAQYAPWFHPSFVGLYADEATIAAMAKDFKIFYAKQPGKDPGSYSIDHSAASYIFDPQGRLRLTVRHGETPDRIAADLKLLLAGK